MFSCYFVAIIRHSIQLLCPVFSRKVFSGVLKVQTKFVLQKHPRAVAKLLFMNMAAEWFLQRCSTTRKYYIYRHFIFATRYLLRETMNSLRGIKVSSVRHNKIPSGCQTCLFRLNEFPSGSQTCLFRHNEFPYGNKYSPSGNKCHYFMIGTFSFVIQQQTDD